MTDRQDNDFIGLIPIKVHIEEHKVRTVHFPISIFLFFFSSLNIYYTAQGIVPSYICEEINIL